MCTTVWRIVRDTLADVLWYIDGNHCTLSESGHGVPAMFEAFHKYNQPENRNRKKIDSTKLKATEVLAHSSSLFYLAGSLYMKKQQWKAVHEATLCLADNLR